MKNEGKEKTTTIRIYKKDLEMLHFVKGRKGCRTLAILIRRWLYAYIKCVKDISSQLEETDPKKTTLRHMMFESKRREILAEGESQ